MRVRTHPTRRPASLIGVLAVMTVLAGLVLVAPPNSHRAAADNHTCGGSPGIDGDGGGVEGFCFGYSPGRQPGTGGYSPAQLWAVYCASFPAYEDGFVVDITFLNETSRQEIIDRGLDPTGTYGTYLVNCEATAGANAGNYGYFIVWELSAPVPLTVLRDRARARINPPEPTVASSPPLDEAGRFGAVGVPTWLWVEDPWEPLPQPPESETSGLITVEVQAFPRHVTWVMGDGGEPKRCEGPGVPWTPSMPEGGTYCEYTYESSSADLPNERYEVTATVEWYFEWWINGAPQGEFEAFDATTPFTYQVGEIQAIESN